MELYLDPKNDLVFRKIFDEQFRFADKFSECSDAF
jgi:hypothetical protein